MTPNLNLTSKHKTTMGRIKPLDLVGAQRLMINTQTCLTIPGKWFRLITGTTKK